MKKVVSFLMALIIVASIAGCTTTVKTSSTTVKTTETTTPATTPAITSPTSETKGFQLLKSDAPKIMYPDVSAAQMTQLVNGNSQFAFGLYQQLLTGNSGNMFISPYSISTAMAITDISARGETEKQINNVLHFILPQAQLHPAFNRLTQQITSYSYTLNGNFTLNVTNALWWQKGYNVNSDYLKMLAQNYDMGVNLLDFKTQPEPSRVTINDWVAGQTNNLIKDLLSPGSITLDTRGVLTDTIYFKAKWVYQFMKQDTRDASFNLTDGTKVTIPMMSRRAGFTYAKGDVFQAVELPYQGNQISMVVLMPDSGNFAAFESSLNMEKVSGIINSLQDGNVVLKLPKFKFGFSTSLKEPLSALGMPNALIPFVADLSGANGDNNLFISDILHKAYVAVDEEGTEAAAATGVITEVVSIPPPPVYITVDHPFIFLIRDIHTGAILFMGRVMNPAS